VCQFPLAALRGAPFYNCKRAPPETCKLKNVWRAKIQASL
jgi:hypothetical protein